MTRNSAKEVLVVGSVALDTVKTPYGERTDGLGGSATFFAAAASLFAPVRVVGVVGEDFPMDQLRFLQTRSVDLTGLQITQGRTFRWIGQYGMDPNARQTLDTQLNVFADFRPILPEAYRDTGYVFLANIDPELQLEVLHQIRSPNVVACDTMNFWIEGARTALMDVLRAVQIVILNDAEVRQLAEDPHLIRAARKVLGTGPKVVIVKKGEHGAFMMFEDRFFTVSAFPTDSVVDPTGAGDAFAGGFMGYLARAGSLEEGILRRAMVYGSAVASFAVEQFSVERLKTLTFPEIVERCQALRRMTAFEEEDGEVC